MIKKQNRAVFALCILLYVSVCVPAGSQASGSAADLFRNGVDRQNSEDWYGASEYFQEALQSNPAYGDAWFHLAQCAYQLGDYNLAVTYSNNAEKYAKSNTDILNLRGMAFISLGKLNDARTLFEKVLASYPNDVDARFGLAELDLFDGKLTGAEKMYQDALRRQGTNRKALLSLALVSAELGKNDTASAYIDQALQYHSGDAGVHYLAAYLSARKGDLTEAEHHARAAVQINTEYDKAYALLASILYAQKKYSEVIDICDYRIGRDRSRSTAWYIKGLSQYRMGNTADAVSTWAAGVAIDPQDEVMRGALEILAEQTLPLEDTRRTGWAQYHSKKAAEYKKQYMKSQVLYEYQRALKIDPLNNTVRNSYAEMLRKDGLNELYLEQLKFIQQNADAADKSAAATKLADTVEAYDSLLSNTLAVKWSVKPFYLDKIRYKLGIYYTVSPVQLQHSDSEWITAEMAAEMFAGVSTTSVDAKAVPVSGYGEAYRTARTAGQDYFIIISVDESSREMSLDAVMYSARTGTRTADFSVFRTGNDRFANALRRLRQGVLEKLPIRGAVIARDGDSSLLVDLGRADGVAKGTKFDVVRKGIIHTADSGPGLTYANSAILGTLTVTRADEEISEGTFERSGFFDRLNVGDEVVVTAMPKPAAASADAGTAQQPAVTQQTAPAANATGAPAVPQAKNTKSADLSVDSLGLKRTPALVDLIRNIY